MLECGGLQYPGVPVVGFLNNERKSLNLTSGLAPVSGRAGAGHLGSCRLYTTMTRSEVRPGLAVAGMVSSRMRELCRRNNQIRKLVKLFVK